MSVFKPHVQHGRPALDWLIDHCIVVDLTRFPAIPAAWFHWVNARGAAGARLWQGCRLLIGLLRRRPDLVVLSQGLNWDGFPFATICRLLRLRYVLISQKATDLRWPADRYRSLIRGMYRGAAYSFFVSEHNRTLTHEQLALAPLACGIVRNPFQIDRDIDHPWPDERPAMRLACVGRLDTIDKGQDILLRILARPLWRARAVRLDIYGDGQNADGLRAMAKHLKLDNVHFAGHQSDVDSIWASHHALVLPSRCEGLPLVIVETMLSARIAIATNVAGNAEMVEDGVSGFLAVAPTEDAFAEAMERAWDRRAEWREMGRTARLHADARIPRDPGSVLADRLIALARAPRSRIRSAQPLDGGPDAADHHGEGQ